MSEYTREQLQHASERYARLTLARDRARLLQASERGLAYAASVNAGESASPRPDEALEARELATYLQGALAEHHWAALVALGNAHSHVVRMARQAAHRALRSWREAAP